MRELLVGLALVWLGFGLQRRIWAASHEQAAKVPPPDPDPEPDEEALGIEVRWEILAPDFEPTPRDACLFHGPGLRFTAEHPRLGGPFVLNLAWLADPGARARVGLEANDPAQVLACLTQANRLALSELSRLGSVRLSLATLEVRVPASASGQASLAATIRRHAITLASPRRPREFLQARSRLNLTLFNVPWMEDDLDAFRGQANVQRPPYWISNPTALNPEVPNPFRLAAWVQGDLSELPPGLAIRDAAGLAAVAALLEDYPKRAAVALVSATDPGLVPALRQLPPFRGREALLRRLTPRGGSR